MISRLKMILLALASGAAALSVAFVAGVRTDPAAEGFSSPSSTALPVKDGAPAKREGIGPALPARPALSDPGTDPFSTSARNVPLVQAAPNAPAAPDTPPLPYRFVGRVYQDGGIQIFIARGAKVIAVSKGGVVDGEYRIDAVSSTELVFTHLRSDRRQVMQFSLPLEDETRTVRNASGGKAQAADASPPAPVPQAAPANPGPRNRNDSLTLERQAHAAPALLE